MHDCIVTPEIPGDIRRHFSSLGGSSPPPAPPPQMSQANYLRKPSQDELLELSRGIVKEWKFIGRRLDLDEDLLTTISANNRDEREKAYQMLQSWCELEGWPTSSSASVKMLCIALCQEGLRSKAATIFHITDDTLRSFSPN